MARSSPSQEERTDQTKSLLRRLFEIGFITEIEWNDLAPTLDRLGEINSRRNDILHHMTVGIAEGEGIVTNAGMAHITEKVAGFRVSPDILDDMSNDLRKIIVHFHAKHMGKPIDDPYVDRVLREPWRYKPQSLPLVGPPKPPRQRDTKKPIRQGRSKPPRE